MSINQIIASGGGATILLLTLIQISPIKVNPWTSIGKAVGRVMNQELFIKLQAIEDSVKRLHQRQDKLEYNMGRDKADSCRSRILRFADEIRRNEKHSEEFFNQILTDISQYNIYCDEHPEYKNERANSAITKTEQVYNRCMEEDSFL